MATDGGHPGPRSAAAGRHQAFEQARPDRQRVPPPGGTPERRRSGRADQARRSAHQPRHGLPHAAVDGRRGHRAQSRFRRRPLPLRALVPPPAALSSDLQDLQPLVRVPQLRHRVAGRGSRGGARLHRAAERRADLRHVRIVPHRRGAPKKRPRTRAAVRARRAAHCDCHRAQRPRVLRPRRKLIKDPRGARGLPQAGRRRKASPRTLEERYQELLEQDPQLESRPTFLFFKGAANGLFARGADELRRDGVDDLEAYRIGIRCERGSHRFFKRYGERFEDSEGKQVFLEFAEEEREHLEMLIREYRALVKRQRKRKAKPGAVDAFARRVAPRQAPRPRARQPLIDLHLHTTASDGRLSPAAARGARRARPASPPSA